MPMQRCSDAVSVLRVARSRSIRVANRSIRAFRAPRDGRCGKSCSRRAQQVKRAGARHAQAMSRTGWCWNLVATP